MGKRIRTKIESQMGQFLRSMDLMHFVSGFEFGMSFLSLMLVQGWPIAIWRLRGEGMSLF